MQTDPNKTPAPPTDTATTNSAPTKPKVDLSITKILGGALAAMTAAALGSRLSVAGTIVGAALASVIAAVAGSLYTASLARTQDKVRTVWTGRTGRGAEPTQVEVRSGDQPASGWWAPAQPSAPTPEAATPRAVDTPARPKARVSWKSIIVGAIAAFGLAAVALTGFEAITGHALSGGDGTTITQVSEPKKPSTKPSGAASKTASPSPEASSAEPSSTATESKPSSQPSPTSSSAPTTAPSTAAPSASATSTPSSDPTTESTPG